ncbi:MAG: SCO family protein [Alphaproteobacteria bacterium]|jgi:protein SCO1/2|nr:SCO family protein [Alphaproteobacteria bacterium]
MDSRRLIAILTGLALAVATGLGAYSLVGVFEDERESIGQVAIGGPFSLVDHSGRRVSEADFKGRHMLLYFGYTFCPDVCPTELQAMSEALDALGPDAAGVQPVFISIDPERDTPAVLAEYRQHFHDKFRMLTGTLEEIRAAAKTFRVYFTKVDDDGSDDYLMDHSSVVYLLDGEGRYVAHFGPNTASEEMARRIREAI